MKKLEPESLNRNFASCFTSFLALQAPFPLVLRAFWRSIFLVSYELFGAPGSIPSCFTSFLALQAPFCLCFTSFLAFQAGFCCCFTSFLALQAPFSACFTTFERSRLHCPRVFELFNVPGSIFLMFYELLLRAQPTRVDGTRLRATSPTSIA